MNPRIPTVVLLIFLLVNIHCTQKKKDVHTIHVSLWANEDHTWYKAFQYFGELLDERSAGRIQLKVFPSEQLAKETESIRLIQANVIEMTVTASLLSNWIEIASFCELPFLLKDSTEKNALIYGPLGQRIIRDIQENMGLRVVALFERGPRQLTSNRPITHPDELNGLIVRVPNVPSFVTAWSAMGAKPTPMAFSEVFTGLQQGTIEAQENPFSLILTGGLSEVQQYVNLTEHVMSWSYAVISERAFQALPEELKEVFLQSAKDMERYEHQLFLAQEQQVKDELARRGMQFIEVDKKAFGERCEEAIYESLSEEMKEVYRQFKRSLE